MKVLTYIYKNSKIHTNCENIGLNESNTQLVLGFGAKNKVGNQKIYDQLRKKFPVAHIAMCSSAGEIFEDEVFDGGLSIVALEFDKTKIESSCVNIVDYNSSFQAGLNLVNNLNPVGLKHILILSDGSQVNGSELVLGIESSINHNVPVTGGLAGDGVEFQSTLVGLNELPQEGNIIAIGFYGDAIKINHGTMGGWDIFGTEKTITKAQANELFEIDGENALSLYKKYLGKYANELPGSALLFPLAIKLPGKEDSIVRTILSINEESNSMIFAGDIPNGSRVRFMKANFDRLIEAASDAAHNSILSVGANHPKLALIISCVGRKIILGKRIDEELEAVREVFNKGTLLSGFYSYGEISPINQNAQCELHNQTMTITTFDEI